MLKSSSSRLWMPLCLLVALQVLALAARFQMRSLSAALGGVELRLLDAFFAVRGPKSPPEMAQINGRVALG